MKDEKLYAIVARSTFASQKVQNTSASEHFSKLRRQKSARLCGGKHIWKLKVLKTVSLGALLEVEMPKKCMPLCREAHFEVKSGKTRLSRTIFGSWDVEKVHAVVARSKFPSQNVKSTRNSDHFLTIRWRFHVEKVHPVVERSTFGSQMCENWRFWMTFDGSDVFLFTDRRT